MTKDDGLKLENQLCFSIYAASRTITKKYRPYLDGLGITYPQYLVMMVLWERETISLKELGNKLYLDSGTLTPLLKRMESMELLKRERSKEDERILCVTITEKGIEIKKKAIEIPECILKSLNNEVSFLSELKRNIDKLLLDMKVKE
ncbi:MAG: ohrR [Clostridiales bacterium]|jgi:DNA-binding MarR family transcriptional regulator|nr:ohrR [Clostridiales bacterium]